MQNTKVTAREIIHEYRLCGPGVEGIRKPELYDKDCYFEIDWDLEFETRVEALAAVQAAYKGPDIHGLGFEHPDLEWLKEFDSQALMPGLPNSA